MTSIIVPCKNRWPHLKECLRNMAKLKGDFELIVVDFNCPQKTADRVNTKYRKQVKEGKFKVVKADVPKDHWNLSESRNYGYKYADGDVLLFIDADTILKSDFLTTEITDKTFVTGTYKDLGNGKQYYWCCGCLLVNTSDFKEVVGYNEELKGWGYEDLDMYGRLDGLGLERKEFSQNLIHNLSHGDKGRNDYHDGQTIDETNSVNHGIAKERFRGFDKKLKVY